MSEIKDTMRRMAEEAEARLQSSGTDIGDVTGVASLSRETIKEWADARGLDLEELESLADEKRTTLRLLTVMGFAADSLGWAMLMYGLQLGFEVAAHRYARSVPTPPDAP